MPSTKALRSRLKSIRATKQITKAMELVSSAKMRKAQQQALATRMYSRLVWELVQNLSQKTDPSLHRLLYQPERVKTLAVILITSNRGLIGGFNNRLISAALAYAKTVAPSEFIHFLTIGKKGSLAVHRRGAKIAAEFEKKDALASPREIFPLAKLITNDFMNQKYDKVVVVNMDFISTLRHEPRVRELLPLRQPLDNAIAALTRKAEVAGKQTQAKETDYLFEPSADVVLERLLPRVVEMQIYQALLETNAAEHSARMVAMKNATDAANDLIGELTLEYNQLRQASITTEISEIVSGQLALNH